MEQFRHIGEVWGSLNALMLLQDDIQINRSQCLLLFDIFTLAFNKIAEEIRKNLKLEEKNTKWKALEHPLGELIRVFKEGELYIRHCLECKEWWGKAIGFHQNNDSVEFHIHNLLCYYFIVVEAIETAGEISGLDQDEMMKRRVVIMKKYDQEWNDPKIFEWRFGKQYLVPREICHRIESAWREDRWHLVEAIKGKRNSGSSSKNELRLGDLLLKKLIGSEAFNGKLFPSSILLGAKDYQVKRRLGGGNQYKEIHWLGESFALRHFFGEIEPLNSEISTLLSLSHPNTLQHLCGFYDEQRKECFLVMELMNKDLASYMKENCSQRRRILFSLPVIVDLMLQIARGMEYLHSQKVYHGDLNPSNILLRGRNSSEGYFHVKVTGFGLSSVKKHPYRNLPNQNPTDPIIWYAPEVLAEQENPGSACNSKHTEKADVYSFGMLCFELLTGKVPFEDGHLQGEKTSRNIRAGERPLFPYASPKYLVNLTRKCWQTDPAHRPTFSSICRILRCIKKFLVMNPDNGQPEMILPPVDYCDIEAGFLKKFSGEGSCDLAQISQIPFQMFAYRLLEKERINVGLRSWEAASDAASFYRDESSVADQFPTASDVRSVFSEAPNKKLLSLKKRMDLEYRKFPEEIISGDEDDDPIQPASDVRSVCSEAPDRKLLSMKKCTFMEFRKGSVAEDPVFLPASDVKSVCSEAPAKKPVTIKKCVDVKGRKRTGKGTSIAEEPCSPASDARSVCSKGSDSKNSLRKKNAGVKVRKGPGTQKAPPPRTPPLTSWSSSLRMSGQRHIPWS